MVNFSFGRTKRLYNYQRYTENVASGTLNDHNGPDKHIELRIKHYRNRCPPKKGNKKLEIMSNSKQQ